MSELRIEARSLSKHYGNLVAVDELSFEVGSGEVLGFLGPNGAGKSTTMKMLTGFLTPTGGTALINGHDILTDSLAARQSMGYLPEGAPAYGEMTVRSFIEFIARARGFRGAEAVRRAGAAIELHAALRVHASSASGLARDALASGVDRRASVVR